MRRGPMYGCAGAQVRGGVKPDMLTFGKGMGGDMPMAGLVMRSDIAAKIPDGSNPNTFAANAIAATVCLTNISLLQDPELDLINRAHVLGLEVQEYVRGLDSPWGWRSPWPRPDDRDRAGRGQGDESAARGRQTGQVDGLLPQPRRADGWHRSDRGLRNARMRCMPWA